LLSGKYGLFKSYDECHGKKKNSSYYALKGKDAPT
jgi:hypothetical protein